MNTPGLPTLPQPGAPNMVEPPRAISAGFGRAEIASIPPILTSRPTLAGLWAAFTRRWRLATGLGIVVGIGAAIAGWFLAPPSSYTAVTMLRVDTNLPKVLFVTSEGRAEFSVYQRSQIALIKSRLVLNSALRDSKAAQLAIVRQQMDPIDWLAKEIQVDFALSPELLRISITAKESDAALTLVDAVREAYLREIVNKEQNQRLARLDLLTKMYAESEDQLKSKRKVLRNLAEDLGSKDAKFLAMRQQFALTELNTIQQELIGIQSQIRKAKLEVAIKADKEKALQEAIIPEAVVEEFLRKDAVVSGYLKEIALLDTDLARFVDRAKNPSAEPDYVRMQKALETAKNGLAARRKELSPKVAEELREQRRLDLKRNQVENDEKISMLEKLDALLSQQVNERGELVHNLSKKTIDLDDLKEDIELVGSVAKRVGSELEALKVEIRAPARVTPTDESFATRRESAAAKVASMAGFGGLGAMLLGVSFLEFRSRRLVNVEEMTHGLGLPVVGMVPLMSSHSRSVPHSGGTQDAALNQILIESVDAARTLILHASRQSAFRVVMVTSAVGGEGKTMLSAHLAASMARAGWRALLVDADFRRPSLEKVFALAEEHAGLSEVLRGEADIREVIQAGPLDGLSVMTAGHCDVQSMRALAQGSLRSLFDRIKGDYDLIIVDSAPVLPVVDSQLIAQAVDGVIISVLRDVSRLPLIHEACERLMRFQIGMLGAVVHGAAAGGMYASRYPYLPVPAAKATVSDTPDTPDNPE